MRRDYWRQNLHAAAAAEGRARAHRGKSEAPAARQPPQAALHLADEAAADMTA